MVEPLVRPTAFTVPSGFDANIPIGLLVQPFAALPPGSPAVRAGTQCRCSSCGGYATPWSGGGGGGGGGVSGGASMTPVAQLDWTCDLCGASNPWRDAEGGAVGGEHPQRAWRTLEFHDASGQHEARTEPALMLLVDGNVPKEQLGELRESVANALDRWVLGKMNARPLARRNRIPTTSNHSQPCWSTNDLAPL